MVFKRIIKFVDGSVFHGGFYETELACKNRRELELTIANKSEARRLEIVSEEVVNFEFIPMAR